MPITLDNYAQNGYRELWQSEEIQISDLICPTKRKNGENNNEFRPLSEKSKLPGCPYRAISTPTLLTTKIIRQKKDDEKILIDIFVPDLTTYEQTSIIRVVQDNPLYYRFNGVSRLGVCPAKNFYLLKYNGKTERNNCLGFTNDKQSSNSYFNNCVLMDYSGVIEYLTTGKVIKLTIKPIKIFIEMDVKLIRMQ